MSEFRSLPYTSTPDDSRSSYDAMMANSHHPWYLHPGAVSTSAVPPTREEMILGWMAIPIVDCTSTGPRETWTQSTPRYPSRMEAEARFPIVAMEQAA